MRTKNLSKILSGFSVLVLAFCLYGCQPPELYPGEPLAEDLAVRSVRFYFTSVTDGQQQCVYGYCGIDECCRSTEVQVDTFRLMSDHQYVCSLELNVGKPEEFFTGTGELAKEYFFSFSPDGGLDLIIDSPEMEGKNYSDLSSNWTTGKPGNGIVSFKIGHCPDNFVENPCFEISLPVSD